VVGRGSERSNVALRVRYAGSCLTGCKKPQSCAPEDGQTFARNMLSWSWRSIKLLFLHLVGFYVTFLPTFRENLSVLSSGFKNVKERLMPQYGVYIGKCDDGEKIPYLNSVLGPEASFWILQPWGWDRQVVPKRR